MWKMCLQGFINHLWSLAHMSYLSVCHWIVFVQVHTDTATQWIRFDLSFVPTGISRTHFSPSITPDKITDVLVSSRRKYSWQKCQYDLSLSVNDACDCKTHLYLRCEFLGREKYEIAVDAYLNLIVDRRAIETLFSEHVTVQWSSEKINLFKLLTALGKK